MGRAACSGACIDIFFPITRSEREAKRAEAAAKIICGQCVVQSDCLRYALANESHGIWGGTNEGERRIISRAIAIDRQDQD